MLEGNLLYIAVLTCSAWLAVMKLKKKLSICSTDVNDWNGYYTTFAFHLVVKRTYVPAVKKF